VDTIARGFVRPQSSTLRVIDEVRAKKHVGQPIDYIYNAAFDEPSQVAEILAEMPGLAEFAAKRSSKKPSRDVPAHMAHLSEWPLLSREQEQHMFRKMNFLKHQLHKLQESLVPSEAEVSDLIRVEELKEAIEDCRDLLICCNQRLVQSQARQKLSLGENIDDLVSDGNMSLMKAVEKFDYSRGNKFSTYATWAIMKNFAKSLPAAKRHKQRYVTGHCDLLETTADERTHELEVSAAADAARVWVNRLLEHLDARTREVVRMRSGLAGSEEMTLEQIGHHFGITKERVRQINVRGIKQLSEWAAKEHIEVM